jgi:hypothetical protein
MTTTLDRPRPRTASIRIALRDCRRATLLLALCLGAGCRSAGVAGADTFTSGGSTTEIEQFGGGVSRSEVIRYPDGQRVITKDGRNTDISIQRGGSTGAAAGRDLDLGIQRTPGPRDRTNDDIGPDASDSSATAAAFRKRMLERMQRR